LTLYSDVTTQTNYVETNTIDYIIAIRYGIILRLVLFTIVKISKEIKCPVCLLVFGFSVVCIVYMQVIGCFIVLFVYMQVIGCFIVLFVLFICRFLNSMDS
jgi:hypothetical protein